MNKFLDPNRIYFDHNSTTSMLPEVKEALIGMFEYKLNPSAVHNEGKFSKSIVEKARNSILGDLGISSSTHQLVFTSCASEANNLALTGLEGYKVFTTTIEHPSVFNVVKEGVIPVNSGGIIDLNALEQICSFNKDIRFLVSIMAANNEIGTIQPIKEAAAIIHKYNGLLHTDAVQAFGKIEFNLSEINADLITVSSHKIGGPFGAAALIYKKSLTLDPLIIGGGQEDKVRSGTYNTPAILGFSIASMHVTSNLEQYKNKTSKIRNFIEAEILKVAPDAIVFGNSSERLPNTSSISMPNVSNETQIIHFDLNGFAVSAGSACSANRLALPRVHMSMGYEEMKARTSLRISLGAENTIEEASKFVECWKELFKTANNMQNAA